MQVTFSIEEKEEEEAVMEEEEEEGKEDDDEEPIEEENNIEREACHVTYKVMMQRQLYVAIHPGDNSTWQ